ncbi:MAG: hypothetical protein WA996_18155 [Candidatus Promineifilaceae bacterium]
MKHGSTIQLILKVGFTSILLGYFLVWLPHQAVGLSLIGLEMGEWTKFLPKVQQDQYFLDHILFYLPPITLSLMLVVWTIGWPNDRWKTWAMRGLAVVISLLAFPPIESLRFEDSDQWLARLLLVILVAVSAVLSSQATRLSRRWVQIIEWSLFAVLGSLGASLPLWTFLVLRPEISAIFGDSVGIGPGLWLNTIGHLIVAGAGVYGLYGLSERVSSRGSIVA